MWKRIVDTYVVNDFTHTRQNVITGVAIRNFFSMELEGGASEAYPKQQRERRTNIS